MENRIGRPQLGNAFARVFGLDDINTIGSVAPEVMPVLSLAERPEYWQLLGGRLMSVYAEVGALAGAQGCVALVNPTNSGILVIVEDALTDASCTWGANSGDPAIAAAAAGFNRDLRNASGGGSAGIRGAAVRVETDAEAVPPLVSMGYVPLVTLTPIDLIVPPGFYFMLTVIAQNSALRSQIRWRERPVMTQDLASV